MPQSGLSYYEIVNNPQLLKKMTTEAGQELTPSEQVVKLEQLMNKKKRPMVKPPEVLS